MCAMASCALKVQETITPRLARKSLQPADFQGRQEKAMLWYWPGLGTGRDIMCASILCRDSVFTSPW